MSRKKTIKSVDYCEKCRNMRAATPFSCQNIADMTGFALRSVQNYEKDRNPPITYLQALIDVLDVRPSYFFDPKDNVIFKKDEEVDSDIVSRLEVWEKEMKYLKSEVAELKGRKLRQEED